MMRLTLTLIGLLAGLVLCDAQTLRLRDTGVAAEFIAALQETSNRVLLAYRTDDKPRMRALITVRHTRVRVVPCFCGYLCSYIKECALVVFCV